MEASLLHFWDRIHVSAAELDPDGIRYEIVRQPVYDEMINELAQRVLDGGVIYESVITPLRGGIFPGKVVAETLGVPMYMVGVRVYDNIIAGDEARRRNMAVYYDNVQSLEEDGLYLIVDDVNHTTRTRDGLVEHFRKRDGIGPDNFHFAAVHEKPAWRRQRAEYIARETNAWIVYPKENIHTPHDLGIMVRGDDGRPRPLFYESWEFFGEKLPVWMIREENHFESWQGAMQRAGSIGFHEDELPDFRCSDFRQRLGFRLIKRYKDLYNGVQIPNDLLSQMLSSF